MPAVNDALASRIALVLDADPVPFDLTGATKETSEVDPTGNGYSNWSSVWFSFTPTVTGLYAIRAESTGLDTTYPGPALRLYTGTAFPLAQVSGGSTGGEAYANYAGSFIVRELTAGTEYVIAVADDASSTMVGTIWVESAPALVGDSFATAAVISTGASSAPTLVNGPLLNDVNGTFGWSAYWVTDFGSVDWAGGVIPSPTGIANDTQYVLVGTGAAVADMAKDNGDDPTLTPYYYSGDTAPAGTYRLLQYLLHVESPAGTDNRWAWPLYPDEVAWLTTPMTGTIRSGAIAEHGLHTNMRLYGATNEAGEPASAVLDDFNATVAAPVSIWRKFTAPSNGRFVFTLRTKRGYGITSYQKFGTLVLEAFTGSAVNALTRIDTPVKQDADNDGVATLSYSIENAVAGTDYYLRLIHNWNSPMQDYDSARYTWMELVWEKRPRPSNDLIAGATDIDSSAWAYGGLTSTQSYPFTTIDAAQQAGEPGYIPSRSRSVWFKHTATITGELFLDLATYDPYSSSKPSNHFFNVYLEDPAHPGDPAYFTQVYASRTPTAPDEGYTDQNRYAGFTVTAGSRYYVQLYNYKSGSGSLPYIGRDSTLNVTLPTPPPAKSLDVTTNDNFSGAYRVLEDHKSVGFSTVGKTFQSGEFTVGAGVNAVEEIGVLNYADDQWIGAYDDVGGKVWAYNSWLGYLAHLEDSGWVLRTGNSGQIGSRSRDTVALFKDGLLYLFGGSYTLTKYDPTTNVVTTNVGPAVPSGGGKGTWADDAKTAVLVLDSYVPADWVSDGAGGYTITRRPADRKFHRYDWAAQTFTELAVPPDALGDTISNVVRVGGYLYVMSGWNWSSNNLTYPGTYSNGAPTGRLYRYDIANDTWSLLPGVHPRPAEGMMLWYGAGNGKLWAAGGDDNGAGVDYVSNTVASYDLTAQTWTTETPLSHFVSSAGVIENDAVTYLVGGWNDDSQLDTTTRVTMRPNTPPGTVWFKWKPVAGAARITTELTPGSPWLHTVDVFTGASISALTRVGGYTGAQGQRYEFTADGTTVYYVRVYSWKEQRSNGVLTVMGQPGTSGGDATPLMDYYFQTMVLDENGYPARQDVTTIDTHAPGNVMVRIGNVNVGQDMEFYVSDAGNETYLATITVTTEGGLVASVPIDGVLAPGTYDLIARVPGQDQEGTRSFTVSSVSTVQPIGETVPTPPPAVQPTTGVRRWVLQDPTTTSPKPDFTFELNPKEMSSPFGRKRIEYTGTTAIDGNKLAFEGQMAPVEWTWRGTILSKEFYDTLTEWYEYKKRVWLTDHFGRAWLVYITQFDPTPRRSGAYPWRHDYSMTALIFQGPVEPVVTP